MARRRLTIKRIDPWSVLKFGAAANVVLLGIFLLVAGVVWYIVDQLQLVDQACGIAEDIGFTSCGVDGTNLFRALALLGALWAVVQTAVMVFLAFLYNLLADLTGGLAIGVVEEGVAAASRATTSGPPTTATTPPVSRTGPQPTGRVARSRPDERRSDEPPTAVDDRTPAGAKGPVRRVADELFGERR